MEGRPDEDDGRVGAGPERLGPGRERRSEPNLWILLGMILLALGLAAAVLLVTAIA